MGRAMLHDLREQGHCLPPHYCHIHSTMYVKNIHIYFMFKPDNIQNVHIYIMHLYGFLHV